MYRMSTHTWHIENTALTKTFSFADFAAALAFVNAVGVLCEEHGHHADICLENYNEVRIRTTTHDAGGITEKDHALAAAFDSLDT